MWDMIYAFGIGISFSVGVGMGAFLLRVSTKEGRQQEREDWAVHRREVEERLGKYVDNTALMATALNKLADR